METGEREEAGYGLKKGKECSGRVDGGKHRTARGVGRTLQGMRQNEVVVVGQGVSGLTSAIALLEAGFRVHALAAKPPMQTTSAVAAAVWYPYKVGPEERVARWAEASLREFSLLAREPGTGVSWIDGLEILLSPHLSDWQKKLPDLRPARAHELPVGRAAGIVFRVPRMEMPIYLPWLERRFRELGGTRELRCIQSFADLRRTAELVVDCTGLAARELNGDEELYPIRGQVLRIAAGVVERFVVDDTGGAEFAFLVPRSADAILGGTAHPGREDLEPSVEESAGIVERCALYAPRVRKAQLYETRVGLRPGRRAVRLEVELAAGLAPLLHNYGHGGAGVTLSWGCARELANLARATAQKGP